MSKLQYLFQDNTILSKRDNKPNWTFNQNKMTETIEKIFTWMSTGYNIGRR